MKSSIVKIAVIGSNSFSGASFVDFALANNLSVMGISRSEQPNDIFLPYSSNTHKEERFKFHQLDLNNNIPFCRNEGYLKALYIHQYFLNILP